jgi:hypothetical protein
MIRYGQLLEILRRFINDGHILELTTDWRAQNDPEFGEFIQDLRIVKNGDNPDYKTYGKTECRKSL